MKMEVKVLSRETIMPSFPTPLHLKTFQLSLLDQLSPMLYIPLLFFYPMKKNNDIGHDNLKKTIDTLKSSLSKTLSRFFLLAGRIVDKSINCNDEGAVFIEASVNCNMFDILKEPNNDVLAKLLPCNYVLCTQPVEEYAQVVVQVNTFNCGGITISLCLLHKLIDGTTFSCFLRSWASANKDQPFNNSSPKAVCSDYYKTFSSLFPQSNLLPFHPQLHKAISSSSSDKKRCCLRRFVFPTKSISDLKAQVKSSNVPNPTCVEALTSFIWKHAMKASSSTRRVLILKDQYISSTLSHVVNLRKRIMEPPLAEDSIGNILWGTISHYNLANEIEKNEVELSDLVGLLRNSFAKINNDYIKGLMGSNNEGTRGVFKLLDEINKLENYYFCTSWRNMSLNEVDFGWGKPLWIGLGVNSNVMMGNIIVLVDTSLGDGVEAWIIQHEKEMEILEQDPQFLEFALLNPSIYI